MKTKRLTVAQAIVQFLMRQHVERDGKRQPFFAGCLGIFGHGCIAGVGQALQQYPRFRYYLSKNEQASVHIAAAFAKMSNRLRTFACVSSIGPGATNMVTGAALATVNRLPVLLLPGDIFARRNVAPVLQQLEQPYSQDISVNDAFKPVSKYWDRINRADQIVTALPEVMRVLTSQAETGAVTLALPQDVQTEAYDYPIELFENRVWYVPRPAPDATLLNRAVELFRASKKPLIVAGGGVLYSEAHEALAKFATQTGIPVGETQAGKGSLPYDHPQNLGAIGVTGTFGANIMAREADLVIGIGTRYSDFTTASKTAFQNPKVRFININIAEFDAFKHSALPIVADARAALEALGKALRGWQVSAIYRKRGERFNRQWDKEVDRLYHTPTGVPVSQAEVIGAVNDFSRPQDVVLCAAGSLPGDLHKLWRTRDAKGYHLEYGYSCMGYEVAGGLGVKMAAPAREVYVMVGDGSWLMMSSELVTSIQEGYKLTVVLLDNHGFQSIGGLSKAIGSGGFGTRYRFRDTKTGHLDGENVPIDFVANARSLGAQVVAARDIPELKEALAQARKQTKTTVIVIETDPEKRAPGYESWWDVPVAEVSEVPSVRKARKDFEKAVKNERYLIVSDFGIRHSDFDMTSSSQPITLGNYIGGAWCHSSATESLDISNPATADVLARVPLSPAAEVDAAVQAASAVFAEWRRTPVTDRVQFLFKLKALLHQHFDELARTITMECGKTLAESRGEMQRAVENVEVACGAPSLLQGDFSEDIAVGIDEIMIRQPLGVCACICPFNFPAMIPFWFMPYAIACGNTYIVKPSEKVPLTMRRIAELVEQTGLPRGVFNLVNGARETVDAILDHPGIRAISFVGSTPVAKHIYARAAANGKRAQCQGGAKNPIIVLPDADFETTSRITADSAFGCAGQRCLAASLVVTVGEARKPFTEAMAEAARTRVVGNGLDEKVQMGPVITPQSKERVESLIGKGVQEGATPLVDGRNAVIAGGERGNFIRPTILDGMNPNGEIVRTEIFGPVLGLVHVNSIDDAIAFVNSGAYGNMACLFTSNGANARKFRYEAEVGNVGINVGVAAPMAFFPFSGARESFFGDLHGQARHVIEFFTQTKVVVERWPKEWTRKF